MDLVVMLGAPVLGYLFNRSGKVGRVMKHPTADVPPHPSGPLVYESDRTKEVENSTKLAAAGKKPVNAGSQLSVVPTMAFDSYAPFSETDADVLGPVPTDNADVGAGHAAPLRAPDKFRNWDPKGVQSQSITETFLSPLSDLPTTKMHANMQPSFGRFSYRNSAGGNKDTLLERFTGASSTVSHAPRREVAAEISSMAPNAFPARGMGTIPDRYSRAAQNVRTVVDFHSPVEAVREIPEIGSRVRILPKDIGATRTATNQRRTLPGVVVPGKSVSLRPMQPTLAANPFDLTTESTPEHGNSAAIKQNRVVGAHVMSSRSAFENEYMGAPSHPKKAKAAAAAADAIAANIRATVPRQQEEWTRPVGAPGGAQRGSMKPGAVVLKDTGRERVTDVIQGGPSLPISNRLRNVAAPESTQKELTSENTRSGQYNRLIGSVAEGAYRVVDPELPMTNKAVNANHSHVGLPRGATGHGPLESVVDAPVTMRMVNSGRPTAPGMPRASWICPPTDRPDIDVPTPLRAIQGEPVVGNPVGRPAQFHEKDESSFERLDRGHEPAPGRIGTVRAAQTALPDPGAHADRGSGLPNDIGRHEAPRAPVPAHMSYDTVVESRDRQPREEAIPFGVPASRIQSSTMYGEQTIPAKIDLSREYFPAPAGVRVEGQGGSFSGQEDVELGGREVAAGRAGHPHLGAGSFDRCAEVRITEKVTPAGRFEVPRVTDQFVETCVPSYRLRGEGQSGGGRVGLPRTSETLTRDVPLQSRPYNVEAANPRLDPAIRVPQTVSDLRPCLSTPSSSRAASPLPFT